MMGGVTEGVSCVQSRDCCRAGKKKKRYIVSDGSRDCGDMIDAEHFFAYPSRYQRNLFKT